MKKLLLSLAICFVAGVSFATIRTVNNQVGSDADYTSIGAAVGASTVGDTIYIQPSPTPYASLSLDKRLVIMGPGHNPSFSPYNTTINSVVIQSGADAAIFKGLLINTLQTASSNVVSNVLVSGCQLVNYSASPLQLASGTYNNWVFEGCALIASSVVINFNYLGSNLIIRNCYIQSNGQYYSMINLPSGTVMDHCIVNTYNTSIYYGSLVGSNVEVKNSILMTSSSSVNSASYNCSACNFHDNILWSTGGTFPSLANNLNNVSPLFVNFYNSVSYEYNWNFNVGTESPAIDAASDGSDIGIYGGIFNYNHAGIDGGTPNVVDFSLGSSTAPAGGTITIHLNATGSGQ
jgi:hypothetical protein